MILKPQFEFLIIYFNWVSKCRTGWTLILVLRRVLILLGCPLSDLLMLLIT